MTWYTDDRRLYWEQRRLDAAQEAASITTNDTRCRWPDCVCYAPQDPQQCRRAEAAESELTTLRARLAKMEEALEPFKAGDLVFYDNEERGWLLNGQFKSYVEGWYELVFSDGSTAIVRPSRVSPRARTIRTVLTEEQP